MLKTVLITGASSGIGHAAAMALIEHGHIVYAGARRVDRMSDLSALGANVFEMDVTRAESITAATEQIISDHGRIDVVIANAGYPRFGSIESVPIDQVQHQYDVNIYGVLRTMQAVLPHMRAQRSGTVILTSSMASRMSGVGGGIYQSTKHALRSIGGSLRQELKEFGIHVSMIEPGFVKTEFTDVGFEAFDIEDQIDDYKPIMTGWLAYMEENYASANGPKSTVDAIVKAVDSDKPKIRYATTRDSKWWPRLKAVVGERMWDRMSLRVMNKNRPPV